MEHIEIVDVDVYSLCLKDQLQIIKSLIMKIATTKGAHKVLNGLPISFAYKVEADLNILFVSFCFI